MKRYSFITENEFRSLLYYQGAVENIELEVMDTKFKYFYKINNAYEVINVLMFPGIENEKARFCVEKREVDEKIFDYIDELLNVYCWLYSAMCKYTFWIAEGKKIQTRRDERKHSFLCMRSGESDSFLSTSLNFESKNDYFQKKDGLVLLHFEAEDRIEHIDVNDVLGERSKFPNEEEILFSPFLYFITEPLPLNENEKQLKDCHGNSPYGKFMITIKGSTISPKQLTKTNQAWLEEKYHEITSINEITNIKKVWEIIRAEKEEYYQDEIKQYIQWKQKLKIYLREMYAVVKYEQIEAQKKQRDRIFVEELKNRRDESNCKREKYEKELQKYAQAENILGVSAGFMFALILIGINGVICKIGAVLLLSLFTFVKLNCENKSLKTKLRQRTNTYLKYDKLLNDWIFEREKTTRVLEKYIIEMREIEKIDNQICEQYTSQMIQNISFFEEQTGNMKDHIK